VSSDDITWCCWHRHQANTGKLSGLAADAAASSAAAAVAGATAASSSKAATIAEGKACPVAATTAEGRQQQQQQQQQQGEEAEELGGVTAGAAAVDISNITDFITVGGGGNQLDSRALRNLVLLHLKKVAVADLAEELPIHDDTGPEPPAAAAAVAAASGYRNGHIKSGFWGEYAVQRQQQQQSVRVLLDVGEEDEDQPPPPPSPCLSSSSSSSQQSFRGGSCLQRKWQMLKQLQVLLLQLPTKTQKMQTQTGLC